MDYKVESKVFVFRRFFGFDPYSMCIHLKRIYETENFNLYVYDDDLKRLAKHIKAWFNFYEEWLLNHDLVIDVIERFIQNPYGALSEIYDTASDNLKRHIDKAIKFNSKERVMEAIHHGTLLKLGKE